MNRLDSLYKNELFGFDSQQPLAEATEQVNFGAFDVTNFEVSPDKIR